MCCTSPWYPAGGTWMNTVTHTCCLSSRRIPEVREGRGHCCGVDKVYQQESQLCCTAGYESQVHDLIQNQASDMGCCGLDVYDKNTQQCCKYGYVSCNFFHFLLL